MEQLLFLEKEGKLSVCWDQNRNRLEISPKWLWTRAFEKQERQALRAKRENLNQMFEEKNRDFEKEIREFNTIAAIGLKSLSGVPFDEAFYEMKRNNKLFKRTS